MLSSFFIFNNICTIINFYTWGAVLSMKLLMIEDNKSVSEMMSMFFRKEKWDVNMLMTDLRQLTFSKRSGKLGHDNA